MRKSLNYNSTIFACCVAAFAQAACCNLPPLLFLIFHRTFGIPLGKITLLITINFFTQLVVDLLSVYFVEKIGEKRCLIAAHVFCAAGLVMLGTLPLITPFPFASMLLSAIVYAIGSGLLEVLVSPVTDACPSKNSGGLMAFVHSFYCWGVVAVIILSTLFLHFFGQNSWNILCILWSVLPVANLVAFLFVPFPEIPKVEKIPVKKLFTKPIFIICLVLMFASGAAELTMSQWASAFAEASLGISKTLGDLLGPCMFAVFMGISRLLFSRVGNNNKLFKVIMICSCMSLGSYLLVSLSKIPALSLVGCAVCGFSVGIFWPGTLSLASHRMPGQGTAIFALLALAGDIGCTSGPSLAGFAASLFNDDIRIGLLFGSIFPVIILLFGFMYYKSGKRLS